MKKYPVGRLEKTNIVKLSILPKLIFTISGIHVKIPLAFFFFFYRNGTKDANIAVELQKTPHSQSSLEQSIPS